MSDIERYFTVQEIATITKISQSMVRKLIREGHLSINRIGTCIRVPQSSLIKLLARGNESPAPKPDAEVVR